MHNRIIAHLLAIYSARYTTQRWSVLSTRSGHSVWESCLYMNGEAVYSAETRGRDKPVYSCMSRGWSLVRQVRVTSLKTEMLMSEIVAAVDSPEGFNAIKPDHLAKSPLTPQAAATLAAQLNAAKWPAGISFQYGQCGVGKLRVSWQTTIGTDCVGGIEIDESTQTAKVNIWDTQLKIVGWDKISDYMANLSDHITDAGKACPVGRSMMGLETFATKILSVKVGYEVEDEWAHTTIRVTVETTAPDTVLKEWVMKNWSALLAPQVTEESKAVETNGSEDGPRRGLLYPTPRFIRINHAEIDVIRENGLIAVDIHESDR